MGKRYLFLIFLSLMIAAGSQTAPAQNAQHDAQSAAAGSKSKDVGNKICPVTGEKIDEKSKVTYEYKGRIYNFCCAACIDEFKKDPDIYIKKIENELMGASKEKSK